MDSYHIVGGKPLFGQVDLNGAKNAALPILAATVAVPGVSRLTHCPRLSDVDAMLKILRSLGCAVSVMDDEVLVDSRTLRTDKIPEDLMKEMRSSVFLMGPLLARLGSVVLSTPGGCEIGRRPIDIHLWALRRLNAEVLEEPEEVRCTGEDLRGTLIVLPFPSVGATENLMMAALGAKGLTRIRNGAQEPEIVDLQNFLRACGAKVDGAGTYEIRIWGQESLHGAEYEIMPDRIEAGTLLAAAAATGGEILLNGMDGSFLKAALDILEAAGCKIHSEKQRIALNSPRWLKGVPLVMTGPYPAFPTDLQSQFLAMFAAAEGETLVRETIFENRFKPVAQLAKMGAKIRVSGREAEIFGVPKLTGAAVQAEDLRGGAALVIAGLIAEGRTRVEQICHIDRGYDRLEDTLTALGADIRREKG